MNAIAMTDHGNLFGAIEFYQECTAAGLNPIVGYEAYVAPGQRTRPHRQAPRRGGRSTSRCSPRTAPASRTSSRWRRSPTPKASTTSRASTRNCSKPITKASSACPAAPPASSASSSCKDDLDQAKELARWFHRLFGNDFYVEMQNNGLKMQTACAEGAIDIANELGLPLVATCDAHYLRQEDTHAHDVLLCINTGKLLNDATACAMATATADGRSVLRLRPPTRCTSAFRGQEEAVKRSQEIADSAPSSSTSRQRHFPVFTPPEKKTPEEYLRELCEAGLAERYGRCGSPKRQAAGAKQRLEHELDIICRMGFAGYFLIVWDFVRFAHEPGHPGRCARLGVRRDRQLRAQAEPTSARWNTTCCSSASSIPNRSEAPDIDIDFCQDRREEVIAYVREKYGEEVGRPDRHLRHHGGQGGDQGRRPGAERAARPRQSADRHGPEGAQHLARRCRSSKAPTCAANTTATPRSEADRHRPQAGRHQPQRRHPCRRRRHRQRRHHRLCAGPARAAPRGRQSGEPSSPRNGSWAIWKKSACSRWTSSACARSPCSTTPCKPIAADARRARSDLERLARRAIRKTYALLQRGDARGVFQLESDGIRELLKRMKPDNIRDLIATNALYRPGPLGGGMVDAYVNRKHGREKPTYAASGDGGDPRRNLRRHALSRADHAHPQPARRHRAGQRLRLHQGDQQEEAGHHRRPPASISSRAPRSAASARRPPQEIFDLICYFARLRLQQIAHRRLRQARLSNRLPQGPLYAPSSWRRSCPARSRTATSATSWSSTSRTPAGSASRCCRPTSRRARPNFTVKDGKIVFGLLAIKGLGRGAVDAIVRARTEKGPFRDFFDFCERIDHKVMPAVRHRTAHQGRRLRLPRRPPPSAPGSAAARHHRGRADAAGPPARPAQPLRVARKRQWRRGAGGGTARRTRMAADREAASYEKEALDFYIYEPSARRSSARCIERFAGQRVDDACQAATRTRKSSSAAS